MGCKELQFIDYLEFTPSGDTPTSLHEVSNLDFPQEKINDANKNVSELIDSNGTIQAHYEYSPFGKVTASNGSYATDNPYRFSSEVADNETGLVYYNYRYYSPELGRCLSRDPIEELGSENLYAFVGNQAINQIDYLGYWPEFFDKYIKSLGEGAVVLRDLVITGEIAPTKETVQIATHAFNKEVAEHMLGKEYNASGVVLGRDNSGILTGKATYHIQIVDPETGNIRVNIGGKVSGDIFGANPSNDIRIGVMGGTLSAGIRIDPSDGDYFVTSEAEIHGFLVELASKCICIKGHFVKIIGTFVFLGADASAGAELDSKLRTAYTHLDATAKIIEWKGKAQIQLDHEAALEVEGSANAGIGGGGEIGVVNLIPHVSKVKKTDGVGGSLGGKLIRLRVMDCTPK